MRLKTVVMMSTWMCFLGLLVACGGGSSSNSFAGSSSGNSSSGSAGSSSSSSSGGSPVAVYQEDFSALPVGSAWLGNISTAVTANCGAHNSNCLRVAYEPVTAIGANGSATIQNLIPLPSASEYSLQYNIMFENGWDFANGGTLPGLSSKIVDPDCGAVVNNSNWSVRPAWGTNGSSSILAYTQTRPSGACGEISQGTASFPIGAYQAVTVYVKLNSAPNTADGIVQIYVNGVKILGRTNALFRATTTADSQISSLMFNTFFGGVNTVTTSWAPAQTVYARFDNFIVYPGLQIRAAP